jgi:hypothetical protein
MPPMKLSPLAPLLLLALLAACSRPTANGDAPVDPSACAKEGQQCTFAAGKVGMCTAKGDCDGGFCFTCMSLH